MRAKAAALFITALVACAAYGQAPSPQSLERVFPFTHGETDADLDQIAGTVRAMSGASDAAVDDSRRAITVRGTAAQIAVAEWICRELGEPAVQVPASSQFTLPDGSGDVLQVFYPAHASTPQDLQEIATIVRSTGDIRRLFVYMARKAVIMRGTPAQMAMAGWFVQAMDNPSDPRARQEFRASGDDVARVFFLVHPASPRDVQEAVTLLRSVADIQRIFVYNRPKAIAMRGTDAQAALAEWLVKQLDQPPAGQASVAYQYHTPRFGDEEVRVFYLTGAATEADRWQIATAVRKGADIQRLFVYNAAAALALRSSADRVAAAEKIIAQNAAH